MQHDRSTSLSTSYPARLGRYRLIRLLGKGGMGEIFLAYDPQCEREVALKRIAPKLASHAAIKRRFLHEAKMTASLSHPSIIPIYSLHCHGDQVYYTMPYIQGVSLKTVIKESRQRERDGLGSHPIGSSIPQLIQLFLKICQAIDYTHSHRVLHRDIKPENIMIGRFGEVIILDWGIAQSLDVGQTQLRTQRCSSRSGNPSPTHAKITGTLNYMAPERALFNISSFKTDLYSLGVLCYQLLTFKFPFRRPSLTQYRHSYKQEHWIDPQELTPHRNIPPRLVHITKKCLMRDPHDRYETVNEMIADLELYIKGKPEWIPSDYLKLDTPHHWQFQENVVLCRQLAICPVPDGLEWVVLMLSKQSYSGNIKLSTQVAIGAQSFGVGLLLCAPDKDQKRALDEGYLFWLGTPNFAGCRLFRANIEVTSIPTESLTPGLTYQVEIEKIDNTLSLYINQKMVLSSVSHLPLITGHVGILSRDARFTMHHLEIFSGSQNVTVNCLCIPDAFLLNENFDQARIEYLKIARSFKGRVEATEALFRAGFTLVKEADRVPDKVHKHQLLSQAQTLFKKLRGTPAAPLEFLGKALAYQSEGATGEELKCLELGIRKYPKHPDLPLLEEQVNYRLHASAQVSRQKTYSFLLLALRHAPALLELRDTQSLLDNLTSSWEKLPFIATPDSFSCQNSYYTHVALQLAFWLSKPTVIYEISQQIEVDLPEGQSLFSNALVALLKLNCGQLATYILNHLPHHKRGLLSTSWQIWKDRLVRFPTQNLHTLPLDLVCSFSPLELISSLIESRLNFDTAPTLLLHLSRQECQEHLCLRPLYLRTLLMNGHLNQAEQLLASLPQASLTALSSPYYPLYGCLLATQPAQHEVARHHHRIQFGCHTPPTTALLSYYVKQRQRLRTRWMPNSFSYERVLLYRDLALLSACQGQRRRALLYSKLLQHEQSQTETTFTFPR